MKAANSKKTQKKTKTSAAWFENLNNRRAFILLALLCFIYYGNTIFNDYSLDDVYVTNNEQVKKGFSAIGEIFTTQYARNIFEDGESLSFGYRPVVKTTFAIEYAIFGSNPHISHLINLLLYLLTVFMVFVILKKLFSSYDHAGILFPLTITILFLIHPVHTEVVSSLKNRDELMSFLFSLLSCWFFYHFTTRKGIHHLITGLVLFVTAYLSKSSAIAFLAVIPFLLWFMPEANKKRIVLVAAVLVMAWIGIKFGVAQLFPDRSRPKQFVENPMLNYNKLQRIPTGLFILLFYLKMIFIPYPMRFYYGYNLFPVKTWEDPVIWISLVIHLALFILALYSFKRKKWLFWGIILYLIFISMYSNIVRLIMGIAADRFLYAASLGFSIVVAGFLFQVFKISQDFRQVTARNLKNFGVILLLLFVITVIYTNRRNVQWKTQESLVAHDIDYLKNSARANYIYAGMLKNEAMKDATDNNGFSSWEKVRKAEEHYRQALQVYPDYYQAYNMLGSIYFSFYKNHQIAVEYFSKAVQINPSYVPAIGNLAWVYFKMKNFSEAEKYYQLAIKLKPHNPQFKEELNRLYEEAGDTTRVR